MTQGHFGIREQVRWFSGCEKEKEKRDMESKGVDTRIGREAKAGTVEEEKKRNEEPILSNSLHVTAFQLQPQLADPAES